MLNFHLYVFDALNSINILYKVVLLYIWLPVYNGYATDICSKFSVSVFVYGKTAHGS